MKAAKGISRATRWLRDHRNEVFRQWDFRAAGTTTLLVLFVASASSSVRAQATTIFLAEAALGIALLAVALTALAILVGLMGEEYLLILNRVPGGVQGALLPYRVVAFVSGLTPLLALTSLLLWGLEVNLPLPGWFRQAFALAVTTGLSVWAIIGTIQLVGVTADHGEDRASLLGGIQVARQISRGDDMPSAS